MTSVEETLALLRHADDTLRHARINHREGLHRLVVPPETDERTTDLSAYSSVSQASDHEKGDSS